MSDLFGEDVEILANHAKTKQKKPTIQFSNFKPANLKLNQFENQFEKINQLPVLTNENKESENKKEELASKNLENNQTENWEINSQNDSQEKFQDKFQNQNTFQKSSENSFLSDNSLVNLVENSKTDSKPKTGNPEKNFENNSRNETEVLANFGIINIVSQFDPNKKSKELVEKINWATTQRKTEFVTEIINLSAHQSVAVRRKAAESLSILGDKETILNIKLWENSESDRTTLLTLRSAIEKLERTEKFGQNKNVLTVSEALKIVKNLIGKDIYQVEGEISEIKFYPTMGYFRLKENQDNSLDCGCYIGKIKDLDFVLNEGLSVKITGRFRLKNSRLSLEVFNIELTGEGALLQNLKKLEEKLKLEGFFEQSRKRQIPKFPTNILLIASGNSAAMGDFLKVLGHRRSGMTVFHQNIKSQGAGAEMEILEELARTNDLIDKYEIDTVVMTRGGGSSDDLFVFNSEKIVRYLHGIKRPIIVAIGHERDVSLTEKAADLRASTPSNAAELVSHSNLQIEHFLEQFEIFGQNILAEKTKQYQNFAVRVCNFGVEFLQIEIVKAWQITKKTDGLIFQIISNIKETLNKNELYYNQNLEKISQKKQQADLLYQNIFLQIQQNLTKTQNQLTLLKSQLEIENPAKILAKGYAIIKQNSQIITKITELDPNQKIQITMSDGILEK